jgi:hypothetical protein
MAMIASTHNKAQRSHYSQNFLQNAFNDVVLADPVCGIYGVTPVESLHALLKGIIAFSGFA